MPAIHFKAKLFTIGTWTILLLPKEASAKLPSRGMVMVKGSIDDFQFQTPLEPDGRGSHWLKFDKAMHSATGAKAGDTVSVSMESTKEWPEPTVPADVQKAIAAASPQIRKLWTDITPMARWDWLRWISSTNRAETRQHHIEVAISKMHRGERRPCCFNRSACTVPEVTKSAQLLEPAQASS